MPEAHVSDLHVGDGDERARRATPPGTARLDRPLPGIVVLTLQGDHDESTWPGVEDALGRIVAGSRLLVDLTHCTRVDLADIAEICRLRARDDSQPAVDLVVPPYNAVADEWRDLLDGQATMIHRSRPHALAAMSRR